MTRGGKDKDRGDTGPERKCIATGEVLPVARMIRALGPHTPAAGMDDYFQHFGNVDPLVVLKIARGMHTFDAGPWLHTVDVPTLVLVGTEDTFSPPELGEVVLRHVPDSELVTLDGGTHGALLEFPAEIHDAMADFLHRSLGHAPSPPVASSGRASLPRRHTAAGGATPVA